MEKERPEIQKSDEQESEEKPDLLARLKSVQAQTREVAEKAGSMTENSSFENQARIFKARARVKAAEEQDLVKAKIIRETIIVPDDKIPDAHKNELNLSSFLRRYLPEELEDKS